MQLQLALAGFTRGSQIERYGRQAIIFGDEGLPDGVISRKGSPICGGRLLGTEYICTPCQEEGRQQQEDKLFDDGTSH
jgi:hypothetical protein